MYSYFVTKKTINPPYDMIVSPKKLRIKPSDGRLEYVDPIEKIAFSVIPIKAAQQHNTNIAIPPNLWCGKYHRRIFSFNFGNKNEANPKRN